MVAVILMWLSVAIAQEVSENDDASTPAAQNGSDPLEESMDAEQSADAVDADAESDDEGFEEVIVFGEIRVIRARARVEAALSNSGYTLEERKDDRTVYRHVSPYKGKVILHDDGWMRVKRQGLRVEGREWSFADRNSAGAWALCVVTPWRCIRVGGLMLSPTKFEHFKGAAVESTTDEVEEWTARIADLAVDRKLEDLSLSLMALWENGQPLEGGEVLATHALRKAALLDYWASRTDTIWGHRVREAVEGFVRGEVQFSEYPFTEAEMNAFNRERSPSDQFPWKIVPVEMEFESSEAFQSLRPRPDAESE